MRPRLDTVALLVAVLAAVGSLLIVPVATDGPDAGAAPADTLGPAAGVVDAVRPARGRLVAPAPLLLVVLPAVAAAIPMRRHAVAPAVVRAPAGSTPPRRVDGRAPPPGFPSSAR